MFFCGSLVVLKFKNGSFTSQVSSIPVRSGQWFQRKNASGIHMLGPGGVPNTKKELWQRQSNPRREASGNCDTGPETWSDSQ